MKKSVTTHLKTGFFTIALSAISLYASAQAGISEAGQKFASTADGLKSNVQKGLLALAFICAAIGLVSVLSKSNVENENAAKHYIKWFTGAGLFALAWALMTTIFSGK
ncbi:MAG: hypothetical protein WBP45_15055 [Daejeonella sp.]